MATTQNVFVYGTLMYPQVLHEIINRVPPNSKAVIHGFKRYNVRDQVFPGVIASTPESKVEGVLLRELTPEDMVIFDEFEGDEYCKLPVEAQIISDAPTEVVSALVYIWQDSLLSLYGEWDPEAFAKTHLEAYVKMCTAFAKELKENQHEKPQNRPFGFGSLSSKT